MVNEPRTEGGERGEQSARLVVLVEIIVLPTKRKEGREGGGLEGAGGASVRVSWG